MDQGPSMVAKTVSLAADNATLRLANQDCIVGMRDMPEGSVDVVVTSPPYNIGIRYGAFDDTADRGDYLDWMTEWGHAVHRVLADDGSLFLNVAGKPSDPMVPHQVLARMTEADAYSR